MAATWNDDAVSRYVRSIQRILASPLFGLGPTADFPAWCTIDDKLPSGDYSGFPHSRVEWHLGFIPNPQGNMAILAIDKRSPRLAVEGMEVAIIDRVTAEIAAKFAAPIPVSFVGLKQILNLFRRRVSCGWPPRFPVLGCSNSGLS